MRITYDKTADAMYVYLKNRKEHAKVSSTMEIGDGVLIDFDKAGKALGIEILGASQQFRSDSVADLVRRIGKGIPVRIDSGYSNLSGVTV